MYNSALIRDILLPHSNANSNNVAKVVCSSFLGFDARYGLLEKTTDRLREVLISNNSIDLEHHLVIMLCYELFLLLELVDR